MKKVVYILGSPRSGSTMLDLIIASHPECASVGELCLLEKRACGLCGGGCDYWLDYRHALVGGRYYETAFDVFGKDITVDSSKKWRWLNARMGWEKYEYKIIHLVRNGLDRLKAKKRLDGYIDKKVVQGWVNTHTRCEEIRKKHKGLLVRYEDIVHDSTFEEIFDFIGIDWSPDYRKFWEYEHHGLLGSKSAYALVKAHRGIEDEHSAFVKQHGFNLAPRLGHEFLDKKDIKTFIKHGGEMLNRKLGYGSHRDK